MHAIAIVITSHLPLSPSDAHVLGTEAVAALKRVGHEGVELAHAAVHEFAEEELVRSVVDHDPDRPHERDLAGELERSLEGSDASAGIPGGSETEQTQNDGSVRSVEPQPTQPDGTPIPTPDTAEVAATPPANGPEPAADPERAALLDADEAVRNYVELEDRVRSGEITAAQAAEWSAADQYLGDVPNADEAGAAIINAAFAEQDATEPKAAE